ncbi:MAG TPA: hypothetical protein VF800_14390, partial [Telluria sp.]
MPHQTDFLARLGLDTTADERATRRAYARLLKQIDQETEVHRFQQLRQDVEAALAWLAARHEGDDDAGGSQPVRPRPPPPAAGSGSWPIGDAVAGADPEQVADQVFRRFHDALPALRPGHLRYDAALAELQRCIDDERLINIAARTGFEARIACFLASRYDPDHDTLLKAATQVFGWNADLHRLDSFGHAGATLKRAIDERTMFQAQNAMERTSQRQALEALRKPGVPGPGELNRLTPHLHTLLTRFPVWMTLIADDEVLRRWGEAAAAMAAHDGEPAQPNGVSGLIVGVILMLSFLFYVASPIDFSQLDARYFGDQPATGQAAGADPAPPADPYDSQPLKRVQLDEISSHFVYRIADGDRSGVLSVVHDVHLDEAGHIDSLTILRRSNSKRYDDAIDIAIRASSPYAASTPRDFRLTYAI